MGNRHQITREKHLDHMVKVVPFIAGAYFFQCYMIMQLGGGPIARNGIFFLGACLSIMIAGFIIYDLTHRVTLFEDSLIIDVGWLKMNKKIPYNTICEIKVTDPGENFSHIQINLNNGKKIKFYFVDEADKIREWIEIQKSQNFSRAA